MFRREASASVRRHGLLGAQVGEFDVDPHVLTRGGAAVEGLGTELRAQAARGEFDTAAMTSVFGLIGSDFMALASTVTSTHYDQVAYVGVDLVNLGAALSRAAGSYVDTDAEGAQRLNLATSIPEQRV